MIMKYMFWMAAVLMVIFRNEAVINDQTGFLSMIMCLIAGCWVYNGKDW